MFTHRNLLWYDIEVRYSEEFRKSVIKLRNSGKTFNEIRKILGQYVPKATLSGWCLGIKMPKDYFLKVRDLNRKNLLRAQSKAKQVNREKRQKFLADIWQKSIGLTNKINSNREVLKVILAFLYLGEGAKWKSHPGLQLGSSDHLIVNLYLRLLRLCYGIRPEQLKCRISFRADQDLKYLEKFWSFETSIPLSNFYKSIPDPRTRGKITKNTDYKGVCVVCGGSTSIQLELETIPKVLFEGL